MARSFVVAICSSHHAGCRSFCVAACLPGWLISLNPTLNAAVGIDLWHRWCI